MGLKQHTLKETFSIRGFRFVDISKACIKVLLFSPKVIPKYFFLAMTIWTNILELLFEEVGHISRQNFLQGFGQHLRPRADRLCKVTFDRLGNERKMSIIISTKIIETIEPDSHYSQTIVATKGLSNLTLHVSRTLLLPLTFCACLIFYISIFLHISFTLHICLNLQISISLETFPAESLKRTLGWR